MLAEVINIVPPDTSGVVSPSAIIITVCGIVNIPPVVPSPGYKSFLLECPNKFPRSSSICRTSFATSWASALSGLTTLKSVPDS
ncbi:hypothetical protein ES708_32978 [subsurface metagenome]